jgi:hypothetical protein
MKTANFKKAIVFCFILVPLLSSIISTVHLVDFFYLGNPSWISYTVAIAIELGAVASFLTLSILSKLNKTIVWGMFIILFFMQVIGNIYFSYDWVTNKIAQNPTWLSNFREMMEFFIYKVDMKTSKMILSLLIGVPIPLISVFLLKSTTDYLGTDVEILPEIPETMDYTEYADPEPDNPINYADYLEDIVESPIEEKKNDEPEIHISEELSEEELAEINRRKRRHPARS